MSKYLDEKDQKSFEKFSETILSKLTENFNIGKKFNLFSDLLKF